MRALADGADADDPPFPSRATITDPDAVRLLTDQHGLRFLIPFLGGAHTLSSAAAALGRPRSTLAYWVPRFVDAGLLVRLRDQRRAGPPMPRYRAAARELVVALVDLPFDRRVQLLDTGRTRLLRVFLDGLDEVLAAERGYALGFAAALGDRGLAVTMVEPDVPAAAPSYSDAWAVLRLDRADAVAMAAELEAVIEKYQAKRGRHRYVAHAGLAPEPKVRWRSADDPRLR